MSDIGIKLITGELIALTSEEEYFFFDVHPYNARPFTKFLSYLGIKDDVPKDVGIHIGKGHEFWQSCGNSILYIPLSSIVYVVKITDFKYRQFNNDLQKIINSNEV